jgi:phage shock protein E
MKTSLSILFPALLATAMIHAETIPNPAINYAEFVRLTVELAPVREKNRITEDQFIQMSSEPKTLILDARSKDRFDRIHVKGAVHLAFTDFTEAALRKLITDKSTRILIYCNNNFDNEPVNLERKRAAVALNVQTFVNLHAYGYTNVRELGPLLDVKTTRIPFEGSDVLPSR